MNYVITIDKEHNGDAWWTAYNATLHPDPRARDIQRVDSIMSQVRNNKSAVIPGDELDVFIEWAESLPGWNDGPEHAPHPLLINEWDESGCMMGDLIKEAFIDGYLAFGSHYLDP